MQARRISITMSVESIFINQGDQLSDQEQQTLLADFLSKISLPSYSAEGEINGKVYDFQLIPNKRSPQLHNMGFIDE